MHSKKRIEKALEIIIECGQIDGAHHKTWVIDQIVRLLTDDEYDAWIKNYCKGEDGLDTYSWDVGIVP